MQTIALAIHPANKDASAIAVRDVHFGRTVATIFRAEAGYVPAIRDVTAPGYFSDEADAIEWLDLCAAELHAPVRRTCGTQGLVRGANLHG